MERQKINIVDKDNNLIGTKYRDEMDYTTDIYQSADLWITNSKGEVLIAQRTMTKDKDPGMWGPAVGGTLDEGETYESSVYREAEEEIGLTGITFALGPLQYIDKPRKQFIQWYTAVVDLPLESFTPQEEEVEQLKWVDKKELVKDVKETSGKYIQSFVEIIDTLNI